MARRWERLRLARPPSHPLGSPEIRLLRAWVQCYLNHADHPLVLEQGVLRNKGAEAEWQTVWLREQARLAGELAVGTKYKDRIPERLLLLFATPDAVPTILGYTQEDGGRQPGLADLTAQEARAIELEMLGLAAWEIRDHMDRRRSRRLPRLAVSTTDAYRSRAKAKLRALFEIG